MANATIMDRFDSLANAIFRGASNPPLIKRAAKLADDIEAEHPEQAARLRTALTKRGESLGNRYQRVLGIRAELFGSKYGR